MGSGPYRGRSPVEWKDILSIHLPSQLGLRPSQPGLRPSQPASQVSGFRDGWLGLRPGLLGLRPGWIAQRGGTDGRMNERTDGRMDGRKISPLPKNRWMDGWIKGWMDGKANMTAHCIPSQRPLSVKVKTSRPQAWLAGYHVSALAGWVSGLAG